MIIFKYLLKIWIEKYHNICRGFVDEKNALLFCWTNFFKASSYSLFGFPKGLAEQTKIIALPHVAFLPLYTSHHNLKNQLFCLFFISTSPFPPGWLKEALNWSGGRISCPFIQLLWSLDSNRISDVYSIPCIWKLQLYQKYLQNWTSAKHFEAVVPLK